MKKLKFILLVGMMLLALLALMACNEECTHTSLTVTSAGNGQHTVACDTCDYETTEKCSGGTATCQMGAVCEKCDTAYGEADANAHTFVNGACTVPGCGATCDHEGKLTTTNVGNGQHKTACSACGYELTESCSGGTATCQKGKLCEICGTEYTAKNPNAHDWNAATGECDVAGCDAVCSHDYTVSDNNINDALHTKTCGICGNVTTEGCTGGTATCQKGKLCENCGTEYTAKNPNAHDWNATTGECDVTGCNAVCNHNYVVSDNQIDDNLHAKICNICQHTITESCSGGSATCEVRAICEKCGAAHGELVPVGTKYKYVVVIGVDGGGTFFRNTDTPNIDKIFANGAVAYDVLTSNPSISAQSWGSLMHGVTPKFHGLTNSVTGSTPYDPNSEFPSFFRVIRENDPNAVLASFSHWKNINVGIIENNLDVYKYGGGTDENLTNQILAYLATTSPTTMFVQFDEVDGAGHGNGYGSAKHLETITRIDGYIGQIYDAYVNKGIIDETLFIVTADHGGTPGGSHGGWTDAEKYIMFAAAGKTVKKGGTIQNAEIRDTAAIVLHALGHEDAQPESWTAYVPGDLFVGVDATSRPIYKDPNSVRYHETEPTPSKDGGKHVTDFVDNDLSVYLPFDGNIDDQCGNTTTANNKLYFIEDGYYGGAIQLDDGYVTLNDYLLKDQSFTASMWLQINSSGGDPVLFSNADWTSGKNPGFTLALNLGDNIFRTNVGYNGGRHRFDAALPSDYREGWMHLTISVDRENNQILYYVDFGAPTVIPYDMTGMSFEGILNGLNIGQDGTGAYPSPLAATMDEFMIFDGAFTLEDNNSLAKYYGKDLNGSSFPVGTQPTDTPEEGGNGYITNFINKDLYAYLPFDGTISDVTGNKQTVVNNTVTYEDAVFGQGAVLNNGYVSIKDYAPGTDSFTISFFIKTNGTTSDPAILGNKSWGSGKNPGFVLCLRSTDIGFNLGNGGRMDMSTKLPYDYKVAWTHVVLVVDREEHVVKLSSNFGEFIVAEIPENLWETSLDAYDVLNIGQDGSGAYGAKIAASMDELMIFNGAFDEEDLKNLEKYYTYSGVITLDGAEKR